MTSHVTRNLTRNEQRVLELCKRFPNAVSCGGEHEPPVLYEMVERLLYAEEVEALLVAECGEGHGYTLLGGLATLMPEADVAEAARLYPHDEVEAEKFLWRRFTAIRRAQGVRPPEPSQRAGTDHAKERRKRAQAKASRRANRRR